VDLIKGNHALGQMVRDQTDDLPETGSESVHVQSDHFAVVDAFFVCARGLAHQDFVCIICTAKVLGTRQVTYLSSRNSRPGT